MDEKKRRPTLFDNPMIEEARKTMSKEDLERYERMGEHLFRNNPFREQKRKEQMEKDKNKTMEEALYEALFYSREALKSGLHPRDLEEKEVQLLFDFYGEKWYEEFGYTRNEVPKPRIKEPIGSGPLLTRKQIKRLKRQEEKARKKRERNERRRKETLGPYIPSK